MDIFGEYLQREDDLINQAKRKREEMENKELSENIRIELEKLRQALDQTEAEKQDMTDRCIELEHQLREQQTAFEEERKNFEEERNKLKNDYKQQLIDEKEAFIKALTQDEEARLEIIKEMQKVTRNTQKKVIHLYKKIYEQKKEIDKYKKAVKEFYEQRGNEEQRIIKSIKETLIDPESKSTKDTLSDLQNNLQKNIIPDLVKTEIDEHLKNNAKRIQEIKEPELIAENKEDIEAEENIN